MMMKMMKMRVSSARLHCLLLLLLSATFSCSSAAPSDSKLHLLLHRSPGGYKQEALRPSLAELLSDLLQVENEALEDDAPTDHLTDGGHMDLERAAGPLLAPRERKAGCKNFFWKTFTSC